MNQKSMFICKSCGGLLPTPANGKTVVECEYCGNKQTVAIPDNEKKLKMIARADELRRRCEFDKAAGVFEAIAAEFPEESEVYWGLILCKYGIEYVDDPKTKKKIPTCHRCSYQRIQDDEDFKKVLKYSDDMRKKVYLENAVEYDELSKKIVETAKKEKPYDVFISYKETDENGDRTQDSIWAQKIYKALTKEGYRVFFSKVTLEGALGSEYEPIIFAALHSAKMMLAVGTSEEYYNAVWVKNEWSRYLALMAEDDEKKFIPCYSNIIPSIDLPKEFANIQGVNLDKPGSIEDIVLAVDKMIKKNNGSAGVYQVPQGAILSDDSLPRLLEKSATFMNLGNFEDAKLVYEKITREYPERYEGWWGRIRIATKDFYKIVRDQNEICKWYGYVKKTASPAELEPCRNTFIKYMKGISEEIDLPAEKNRVEERLKTVQAEWNSTKANLNSINKEIEEAKSKLPAVQKKFKQVSEKKKAMESKSEKAKSFVGNLIGGIIIAAILVVLAFLTFRLWHGLNNGDIDFDIPNLKADNILLDLVLLFVNIIIAAVAFILIKVGLILLAIFFAVGAVYSLFSPFKALAPTDANTKAKIFGEFVGAEAELNKIKEKAEKPVMNVLDVDKKYAEIVRAINEYKSLPKNVIVQILLKIRCDSINEIVSCDEKALELRKRTF